MYSHMNSGTDLDPNCEVQCTLVPCSQKYSVFLQVEISTNCMNDFSSIFLVIKKMKFNHKWKFNYSEYLDLQFLLIFCSTFPNYN